MPNYAANPYHAQTPIGQSLQNLVGMYFQSKLAENQRADQQAQMALKQREFDEVTLPMKQAQMEQYASQGRQQDALAGKAQQETAQMQNLPGVMAQLFTGKTAPQIDLLRQGQQTGSYGEAPTIPGLDQLGQGGDWMPTYADPQTMNNLALADVYSNSPGNADERAKAIGALRDQQITQDAIAGLFTPDQMTALVQSRYKAAPFSAPNSMGQVGNLVTGEASIDTPQARSKIASDSAYQAKQYSGVALDKANVGKVNAQTTNERAGGGGRSGSGGLKGGLTEKQRFDIRKKDDEILTARKKIKAYKDSGKDISKAKGDKAFQATRSLAMQRMQEGEDTDHQTWVDYLSGGYEDKDAWAARSQQPAQRAQPAQQSAVPPPAQRVRGQVYQTPKGPMTWTGTGWVPGA